MLKKAEQWEKKEMKRVQIEVQDLTKDDDERIPRDPRRRDARPRSPRGDPRLRGEPAPAVVDPYQEIVEPEASISVEVLGKVKTSKPRRPKRREQARRSRVPGYFCQEQKLMHIKQLLEIQTTPALVQVVAPVVAPAAPVLAPAPVLSPEAGAVVSLSPSEPGGSSTEKAEGLLPAVIGW